MQKKMKLKLRFFSLKQLKKKKGKRSNFDPKLSVMSSQHTGSLAKGFFSCNSVFIPVYFDDTRLIVQAKFKMIIRKIFEWARETKFVPKLSGVS